MKRRRPKPTPELVRKHRELAGLTQIEAAEVVHLTGRQRWWEYEKGRRVMPLHRWELFLIKTGQLEVATVQGPQGRAAAAR